MTAARPWAAPASDPGGRRRRRDRGADADPAGQDRGFVSACNPAPCGGPVASRTSGILGPVSRAGSWSPRATQPLQRTCSTPARDVSKTRESCGSSVPSWPQHGRSMNPLRSIAVIALASSVGWPAHAGVIRGTLRVPPAGAPQAMAHAPAYPGRASSLASVTMVAHGLPTDAVIYVEKVPAEPTRRSRTSPRRCPSCRRRGRPSFRA